MGREVAKRRRGTSKERRRRNEGAVGVGTAGLHHTTRRGSACACREHTLAVDRHEGAGDKPQQDVQKDHKHRKQNIVEVRENLCRCKRDPKRKSYEVPDGRARVSPLLNRRHGPERGDPDGSAEQGDCRKEYD